MHNLLFVLMLIWAGFGHLVLCLALVNRAHATGIPTRVGKLVWLSVLVLFPAIPAFFGYWTWLRADRLGSGMSFSSLPGAVLPYLITCWIAAIVVVVDWMGRKLKGLSPDSVRSDRRRVLHLLQNPEESHNQPYEHHLLVRLPGNQCLDLDVVERGIDLDGLPSNLDGLTIVHLSDLHFTGRVAKSYFREVMQVCNDLEPDLIAITGDLIDSPACIDWIPDTFGCLRSRYGNCFVLGNHDVEVGPAVLRETLTELGFIDLAGRWTELMIAGERIVLAGNELPWLPPAADFSGAPVPSSRGGPLRIGLSHSPDQVLWARRNEVDLLLAGHLHGGQIRLPFVGPVVSPSWHGVRYAAGVFRVAPTVMHVSRGVSGEIPLRLNCAPEVGKLTLHAPPREF